MGYSLQVSCLTGQGTQSMRIIKTIIALSCTYLLMACGGPTGNTTVPEAQPAGATSVDIGDHIVHFIQRTIHGSITAGGRAGL
jgi:hypothetical protein